MMIHEMMTRRSFVRMLIGLLGLATLQPLRAFLRFGTLELDTSLSSKLVASLAHPVSAATVGRAYLRSAPQEADERGLLQAICSVRRGWRKDMAKADSGRLRKWLSARVRGDFISGRTTTVEGWMLSETEARLCALAALRNGV